MKIRCSSKTSWAFLCLGLAALTHLTSCTENYSEFDDVKLSSTELIEVSKDLSSELAYEDGRFVFSDAGQVTALIDQMTDLERDDLERNASYDRLGLDKPTRQSMLYYPHNPICRELELSVDHASKRRAMEMELEEMASFGEEPNELIQNAYLNAILNENGEMKLGSKYVKVFDDGDLLLVENNDLPLFTELATQKKTKLKPRYNARLISRDDTDLLFTKNLKGEAIGDLQYSDYLIYPVSDDGTNWRLINHSYAQGNSYQWTLPNGTIINGAHPTVNDLQAGDAIGIKANNEFEMIIIIPGDPDPGPSAEERGCSFGNFTIQETGGTSIQINHSASGNFTLKWEMGDGTTLFGENITHSYASSGPFTITGFAIRSNGSVGCSRSKVVTFDDECGDRSGRNDEVIKDIGNDRFKLKVWIWVEFHAFNSEVTAVSKLKKRGFANAYYGTNADDLFGSLLGFFWEQEELSGSNFNCLQNFPELIESEVNSGYLANNYSDYSHKPYYQDNQLFSTHRAEVNGGVIEWTSEGGKFFLR